MYYGTPFPLRFNKPAVEAVIDLINQSNSTNLEYSQLTVGAPVVVYPASAGRNTRIACTLMDREDPKGTANLYYNRLDLAKYIGPLPVYVEATEFTAPQAAIDILNSLFHIGIGETQASFDWLLDEPDVNGCWPVVVDPLDEHLIWIGTALVYAVPTGHIALALPNQLLPGLTAADLTVSAG